MFIDFWKKLLGPNFMSLGKLKKEGEDETPATELGVNTDTDPQKATGGTYPMKVKITYKLPNDDKEYDYVTTVDASSSTQAHQLARQEMKSSRPNAIYSHAIAERADKSQKDISDSEVEEELIDIAGDTDDKKKSSPDPTQPEEDYGREGPEDSDDDREKTRKQVAIKAIFAKHIDAFLKANNYSGAERHNRMMDRTFDTARKLEQERLRNGEMPNPSLTSPEEAAKYGWKIEGRKVTRIGKDFGVSNAGPVPQSLLAEQDLEGGKDDKFTNKASFKEDDRVFHPDYGKGYIVETDGTTADVDWDNGDFSMGIPVAELRSAKSISKSTFRAKVPYRTDSGQAKTAELLINANSEDEAKAKIQDVFYSQYPMQGGYWIDRYYVPKVEFVKSRIAKGGKEDVRTAERMMQEESRLRSKIGRQSGDVSEDPKFLEGVSRMNRGGLNPNVMAILEDENYHSLVAALMHFGAPHPANNVDRGGEKASWQKSVGDDMNVSLHLVMLETAKMQALMKGDDKKAEQLQREIDQWEKKKTNKSHDVPIQEALEEVETMVHELDEKLDTYETASGTKKSIKSRVLGIMAKHLDAYFKSEFVETSTEKDVYNDNNHADQAPKIMNPQEVIGYETNK